MLVPKKWSNSVQAKENTSVGQIQPAGCRLTNRGRDQPGTRQLGFLWLPALGNLKRDPESRAPLLRC